MASDIYVRVTDNEGSEDSPMQNDDEQTKEVVKFLKELRSNLDENRKDLLDNEVKQVTKECKERGEQSLRTISEFMRNFVNVEAVKLGLNLETMKQIIRVFLLCWNKQGLAERIMKEIYDEDENEEPEVDEQMPAEVKGMDNDAINVYAKALSQGFEEVKRIRLMVVGMFSVGKTSLVNNLVEELSNKKPPQVPVEDQFPLSTEGIDVHLCLIDCQNKWKKQALAKKARLVDKIKFANVDEPYEVPKVDQEIAEPVEPMNYEHETMDIPVDQDTEEEPTPSVVNDIEQIKQRVRERQHEPEVMEVLQGLQKNKIEPNSDEVDAQKAVITDKEPLVSVWDFAGQNLYYSTHHFFLNKRSIYLLLMDMTKDLNTNDEESDTLSGLLNKNFTCLEAFKFWLNSIHMYSSIHDQEHEVQPTVILVGTHKDEMKCKEEEKEYKMEAFFTEALESFENNKDILQHIHAKKFLVNNIAEGDPVFDELRAEVKMLAEKQHYWNEKSPTSFVQLEKSLDTMRAEGKELVSLSDVQVANRKNLKPVNDRQLRLFLELQHMFGNILHFDTEELKKYVILAPQWIIEAFKCFITHKPKKDLEPEHLQLWKEYKDYAIIKPILMKEIIRRSKDRIKIHGEAVVQYMEYLNIMSKPVENYEEEEEDGEMMATDCFDSKTNAVGIPSYNSKMHDFHIVPCQLKAKPKEKIIEELICPKNWETTPALCFVFKDKFMPPAVFHRLLAACIRRWEIAKQTNDGKKEPLLFNGIGGFKTCKRSQLRLWYCDHIIYARMIFMPKQKQETEEAIDRCKCQDVSRQLYRHLMAILGLLPRSKHVTKTTPFEEHIQCPNLKKHNHGLFRVNDFIYEGNMSCNEDHDAKDAHSIEKSVLKCWYHDALEEMEKYEEDNSGDLCRVPEDNELSKISRGLEGSKEFWLLGIELGIPQPTMEQLKRDHWKESRSVFIYHVLYEWKKSERQNATLSNLKRKVFAVQKNSDNKLGSIFRCLGTRMQGQGAAAANGMVSAEESGNLQSETQTYFEPREVHWKNDVPTDLQLMKLAELVGGEWKRLGLELNLTEPKLQQLNVDHYAKGVVIVVYEMLLVWKKRNSRPTLLDLGTCIVRSGVSFDWDRVPEDVLEETRDLGDEAMESPEMDTQTGAQGTSD
ncbi:uncharacterized protein LOC128244695 isoform X2 [Mya arenaria]|uniref:uncharacterized protein LOC128244695 isoform X2 n=1 Tax=Mya arenaria TaxID=6604 RepID=UPI0022E0F11B|nr:uncharacterized protein LOC128244695 isoform X2 [Mya arenaria]